MFNLILFEKKTRETTTKMNLFEKIKSFNIDQIQVDNYFAWNSINLKF